MKKFLLVLCFVVSAKIQAQNVGIGTNTPIARLHVADSNVLFFAPGDAQLPLAPLTINGPGRRMLWFPGRAAFRVGYAQNEWDQDSIGRYSLSTGWRSRALAPMSASFGEFTRAAGGASLATGSNTSAAGYASLAGGFGSKTSGYAAIALGFNAEARADYSIALGYSAQATGITSFATGYESRASNNDAAAFNQLTVASGVASFAAGTGTRAKALSAASFGRYNDSTDVPDPGAEAGTDRIFQIGNGTADDNRRNAITILRNGYTGINTATPRASLHVVDSAVIFESKTSFLFPEPTRLQTEGAGRKLIWYPGRSAFRVGSVFNRNWDNDSLGLYSVGMGINTKAIGFSSTAFGNSTVASTFYSTAMGLNTIASGEQSTSLGVGTQARGDNSIAMGNSTVSGGNASLSSGTFTIANGRHSFSAGLYSEAKSFAGFSLGAYNNTDDNPNAESPANVDRIFQVGNGAGVSNRSNALTILRNGNIGLGNVNSPNAPIHFNNNLQNRKIILYENANNDHQYYGFGINGGALRYQTDAITADHVFYAAINASSSVELMRIKGNGAVGFNTDDPQAWGHGGANQFVEIRNRAGGLNAQSHLILSTSGSSGSMGGVTWTSTEVAGEKRAAFIGAAYEGATNDALFQVLLRNNGSLAQRFRVNSNGNAWLQGALTQFSDANLKKNIEPISNATTLVEQLNGYRYNWINADADTDKQLGLLAQEVQKVLPELVKANEDGKLGVNYIGLIPVLVEALKEQETKIQQQQDRLNKLELQVAELLKKLK